MTTKTVLKRKSRLMSKTLQIIGMTRKESIADYLIAQKNRIADGTKMRQYFTFFFIAFGQLCGCA